MTTKQGVEFDRIINAPVPGLGFRRLGFQRIGFRRIGFRRIGTEPGITRLWTFQTMPQFKLQSAITLYTYRPTKFSSTLLFPALWLPTTAIWGRSSVRGTPNEANASCSLFTIGISCSMPKFPVMLRHSDTFQSQNMHKNRKMLIFNHRLHCVHREGWYQ